MITNCQQCGERYDTIPEHCTGYCDGCQAQRDAESAVYDRFDEPVPDNDEDEDEDKTCPECKGNGMLRGQFVECPECDGQGIKPEYW